MSDTKWYIRLNDEVLGPMSEAELHDLAARGALTRNTPLSQDRMKWTYASAVLRGSNFEKDETAGATWRQILTTRRGFIQWAALVVGLIAIKLLFGLLGPRQNVDLKKMMGTGTRDGMVIPKTNPSLQPGRESPRSTSQPKPASSLPQPTQAPTREP